MEFTQHTDILGKKYRDEQGNHYELLENGNIAFGDVSRNLCGTQGQYGSFYVNGIEGEYPALGTGLRFSGDARDYHELGIHPEDVEEFALRYNAYRAARSGGVIDKNDERRRATDLEVALGRQYLKIVLNISV